MTPTQPEPPTRAVPATVKLDTGVEVVILGYYRYYGETLLKVRSNGAEFNYDLTEPDEPPEPPIQAWIDANPMGPATTIPPPP
ncbi:hypothetical protein [Variovorax sp. GT1P44]|uniref:hypothetical protein n=1 Tax=Variovorax sp. GT1P44 TaxID=3443742 RepID=UPI003F44804E